MAHAQTEYESESESKRERQREIEGARILVCTFRFMQIVLSYRFP